MSIIYLITNNVNGKRYIGKTTKTMESRFRRHKYSAANPKTYLHKAMAKYGFDAFVVSLIEHADDLDSREKYWIAKLQPEYNMTVGGEGGDTSKSPNFVAGLSRRECSGQKNSMFGRSRTGELHRWTDEGKRAFKKKVACPVVCEGVEFASVGDAQAAYPGCNIRKRLDNPKYTEFFRLRDKTPRK